MKETIFNSRSCKKELQMTGEGRKESIALALEGRSQSEVLEERLLAIEARLDKLEKVGRKQ